MKIEIKSLLVALFLMLNACKKVDKHADAESITLKGEIAPTEVKTVLTDEKPFDYTCCFHQYMSFLL